MNRISLSDLDLMSIGHEIQLWGAVYSGMGRMLVIPLPDEDPGDIGMLPSSCLVMNEHEMEQFLRQTDLLETHGPGKAILRKSQRQIDQAMAWRVFKRDGYRCRYCGEERPLTVDHVDTWEEGGVTIERNLLAVCRRCNKTRGRMPYEEWIKSPEYAKLSVGLPLAVACLNISVQGDLPELRAMRVAKQRSR